MQQGGAYIKDLIYFLSTSNPVHNLPKLNYDPKKDKINPKHCQICVQRLEEKKSDVIFPNPLGEKYE